MNVCGCAVVPILQYEAKVVNIRVQVMNYTCVVSVRVST